MYSDPPSRIDGRVLEPAYQSIPGALQIEADAMKTRAGGLDGHVPRAESARNPSRSRASASPRLVSLLLAGGSTSPYWCVFVPGVAGLNTKQPETKHMGSTSPGARHPN
jgi:hypothetical protein